MKSTAAVEPMAPHPVIDGYYKDEHDRPDIVRGLFDASAPSYDRITGLMSFGTGERSSNRRPEHRSRPAPCQQLLDDYGRLGAAREVLPSGSNRSL